MEVVQFPDRARRAARARASREVRSGKSTLAAIDVGSTKICCLIAEPVLSRHAALTENARPDLRILGFGHQAARGIRAGVIVNVAETEKAIRLAVDAAERMAGFGIGEVLASVSGGPAAVPHLSRSDADHRQRRAAGRCAARARRCSTAGFSRQTRRPARDAGAVPC